MQKTKISLIVLLFSMLLISCNDTSINMLTKINPNGSCTREFTQKADSAFIVGDTNKSNPFPFYLDSLWEVKILWDTEGGKIIREWPYLNWAADTTSKKENIRAKATRYFPLVEDLNNYHFFSQSSWESFYPKIDFEKKFRWFYTYYNFKERYPKFTPFDIVPITNYLSEEEVKVWFQGDDKFFAGKNGIEIGEQLGEIEKKYEKWSERNVFEEQYQVIIKNMHLLNDPKVALDKLYEKRDTVFKKYRELEDDFPELLLIMDSVFFTNSFSEVLGNNQEIEDETANLFVFLDYYTTSVNYELIMPGKILKNNSKSSKGDTLFWKVDTYRFTELDYEIFANSRKVNGWAFVLSGVFIMIVVLSYFITFKKK